MFTGLKTDSLVLSRLLDEPYAFAIPPYQRSYSWTTKEVGQLLEDIAAAAGVEDAALACPDYFLGTVLLLDPNADHRDGATDATAPRAPLDVVDGQQRLLTISLLARVLEGSVADDALAARLRAALVDRTGKGRIEVFDEDRPAFQSRVLALPGTEAAPAEDADCTPLDDALTYLRQEVSTLSPQDQHALGVYLIERCHVVVIITRDIDRAHLMFTVLNDRGRPLQRKDILKVEVLKNIVPEREDEALTRWDQAAGKLGNDFENLFSHIRSIHTSGRPQIISALRTLVRQRGCMPFLEEVLTPLADAFHLVRRFPEVSKRASEHPELAKALISLNRFGQADWVPPAMLAMSRFEHDPKLATRIVCEIERMTYLMKVLALGGNRRIKRLSQLIQALRRDNATEIDMAFSWSRDEQRSIVFHMRDIHNRNPALAKLILMRIEDELAGSPLLLSTSELSVEHVLPKRPAITSDWRRVFGDRRETCLHSLGNLALVTPKFNDKLSNREFAEKVAMFAGPDSGGLPALLTSQDIVEATEWTPAQVYAREERMLTVLARLWRIEGLSNLRESADAPRNRASRTSSDIASSEG